jgi:VWFA-related protein
VGVVAFSKDIEMVGEFGDPRARTITEIEKIATPQGGASSRFSTATGTSLYDALYLALEESPLKKAETRKAIVCMSDGVDSTSLKTYREIAPLIERTDATIYFLELNTEEDTLAGLLKDRGDPDHLNFSPSQLNRYFDEFDKDSPERYRPRESLTPLQKREINGGLYDLARKQIHEMSTGTGGHSYPVKTLADLGGVYKQIADDLRSVYSLSYYPANRIHDGSWRKIRVTVKPAGATVRTRSGYRAPE